MFDYIRKILADKKKQRYAAERAVAEGEDEARRLTLAGSSRTHQEILYYLAEHDPDPKVRKAVAGNAITPYQAMPVLAGDIDSDVRMILAQRLVRLLPDLTKDKQSQLYAFTVQSLGTLALDEVMKIRLALSSSLKDKAYAPHAVVSKLARDIEREVSEPVLRFCTALSDSELIEILNVHPAAWVVQAIAARDNVSASVARAVIDTDDMPAGVILLSNEGADITRELLEEIVEKSRNYPEWQKPIATRKHLPPEIGRALAAYAESSIREILLDRTDFDASVIEEISELFRRRLKFAGPEGENSTPQQRVQKLEREGDLTEETISDAIAMRDRDLVCAAVARLAKTNSTTVEKVFALKAPKPVVAICWHAGLSMRLAFQMQQDIAHIQPRDLIYPRDGTDYPLTDDEMIWQLEFVGVKAA